MAGWGNWLDSAKELAANLDKQINDSVGVEGEGAPGTAVQDDLNDAWNDDFGDDDLLDQPITSEGWTNNDHEEEEEVDLQQPQQQEDTFKQPLFSSPLPPLSSNDLISSVPSQVASSVSPPSLVASQEEEEEKGVASTPTITDHFSSPDAAAVEESSTVSVQEDGWNDDDLHVDSADFNEDEDETPVVPEKSTVPVSLPQREVRQVEEPQSPVQSPGVVVAAEPPSPEMEAETPPVEEAPAVPSPPSLVQEAVEEVQTFSSPPSPVEPKATVVSFPELPAVQQHDQDSVLSPQQPSSVEKPTEETLKVASSPEAPVINQPTTETNVLSPRKDDDTRIVQLREEHDMAMAVMQSQMEDLQFQLRQREDQLASKAEQLSTMQAMFESEKDALVKKIADTKDEAKRRILKAKERVEAMEKRVASSDDSSTIIDELRKEGQKLAEKQSEMEKLVRAAKSETRDLTEELDVERNAKEKALEKISKLEADLKQTKDDLASARRGENQVFKLEAELASVKEESERKATANLSLEHQVKELKEQTKELLEEVETAKQGAAMTSQMESKKLKREHSEMLTDLETKLRTSEREANLREDALRKEVEEIRKRWQDAVRRADALSMDVQQSTAPLLRQLESMERQSRVRGAAWAELETKLRSDLENSIIENEQLVKERNELKSTNSRFERKLKERDEELSVCKTKLEDMSTKLGHLETKLASTEAERQQMKEKYEEVEKVANEGVSKVRSDMMQTVVESEERYRAQIETLEKELREQSEIRSQLEGQVEQLLENTGMMQLPVSLSGEQTPKEKPKKLRSTQGQSEILANALTGLDSDDEDDDEASVEDESMAPSGPSSFAAMEELNQRLRATNTELVSLREQLAEAERTRDDLMSELIDTRQAREKLPLFEARVKELTQENHEKELEIKALKEDFVETQHMYRMQISALWEEKANNGPMNGNHKEETSAAAETTSDDAPSPTEQEETA